MKNKLFTEIMNIKIYIKILKRYFFPNGILNAILNDKSRIDMSVKYYTEINKPEEIKRGVVICFDGHILHGGLADRMRGIVSVYAWCKRHNVPFYIYHNSPIELDNCFIPNKVNWRIKKSDLLYNKDVSLPYVMMEWSEREVYAMLDLLHFIHPQKQLHIYTNCFPQTVEFNKLFHELFRLEPSFNNRINALQEQLFNNKSYIAISLRFNQLLGDFKDTIGKPLKNNDQEVLIKKCIYEVKKLRNQIYPQYKVLVTADSTKFVERISKELDFVVTIPGKSVHIDQIKDENNDAYTKVFIDMIMLSRAQKIYLFKTGKMYSGAFAKCSSMIGNVQYEIHEF